MDGDGDAMPILRAPFPWFGGKSRAAALCWQAFGADVANYVEPFAGSLAVLLARPGEPRIETVNDLDAMVANFWRAVSFAPDAVAAAADWPVNEADLHARHLWLVQQAEFRERMKTDPEYFDAKIAGWWVWGISQWIGSGWCALPKEGCKVERKRPQLGTRGGRGVQERRPPRRKPLIGGTKGTGVHKRSMSRHDADADALSARAPTGIHARGVDKMTRAPGNQFGYFGARAPMGVNGVRLSQKLPCIGGDSGATGRGIHASAATWTVYDWMRALQERLRRVRVCCGDWRRILGPSPTTCIGTTAVLLDPPYSAAAGRSVDLYAQDDLEVAHAVREWAIANGDNPQLRIALCGYEGEHEMPADWTCVAWEAAGGYGSKANARRERIWFSPACLTVRQQLNLFGGAA